MRQGLSRALALVWLLICCAAGEARAAISVVAAEDFYGDIARQVGGEDVAVVSILANPDQDPHLFEVTASVARAVSAAQIVVYNGVGYDPWMERLLAAANAPARSAIDVGALAGHAIGRNPHIWFLPDTMSRLAVALAARYAALDPAHAQDYARRLALFQASLVPISARIGTMRARLQGMPVAATEPVFGTMFAALGLVVREVAFQRAVMNETEAGASDVAAFETDLRLHRVRLLVFNSQASDAVADRMKAIARAADVPIVGISETEPAGMGYQAWVMAELDAVDKVFSSGG